jgi:hypothetical protein
MWEMEGGWEIGWIHLEKLEKWGKWGKKGEVGWKRDQKQDGWW